jgi:hypothetical protein
MIPLDKPTDSVEVANEPDIANRKRKRSISNLPKTTPTALHAPLPTKTTKSQFIEDSVLSSNPSNEDPPSTPILSKVLSNETDRLGSASPRTVAAKQFAHLLLSDQSGDEQPVIAPVPDEDLSIPQPTELRLDAIRTEETSTPPAKRIPPPRGIKSPRPRHKSSPFKLPSPSTPSTTASETPSTPTSTTSSRSDASLWDFDFDFRALTWQDSEITGHLMLDPDDDGTGINGIGFRPTAATATARSQRRRKQVLDWKATQAKEERERRAQRRGHGIGSLQLDDSPGKKIVRFAV